MLSIWIIHRDPKARAAIARISGVGERAVLASPTDRVLERADAPTVVVLGLSGDFEVELDFVHRHSARLAGCDWILLAGAGDLTEVRRLFDTLPSHVLTYPPEPRDLRRALRASIQQRDADPLSARQGRAELQARFSRWFGDLELPELIRALDPRLARVPVLIHGEEGTGRGLLARYIHVSTGASEDSLVQVSCREQTRPEDLIRQMQLGEPPGRGERLTFYFEDVDRLHTALQHRLRDWIEFGVPEGGVRRHGHRFMASAASPHDLDGIHGLDPRLAETLSGLTIPLPPLRTRAEHVSAFVVETAGALARARGEAPRRFSEEAVGRLTAHPWPGNLHELEALIVRTMAFTSANPIEAIQLRFPSDVPWLEEPEAQTATTASDPIDRPTAFPDPLTGRGETGRRRLEPIDDLADLDPGAAPGHENDLEVGRFANLGGAPVPPEAIEFESDLEEMTIEIDEEALFPEDDLEDADEDTFPQEELADQACVEGNDEEEGDFEEPTAGALAAGSLVAELLREDEWEDKQKDEQGNQPADEVFADVELIEDPEATQLDPFGAPFEIDSTAVVEPEDLLPDVEAPAADLPEIAELLPGVAPLAPPVRPFPEAGDGDPTAASLAEASLPFVDLTAAPIANAGERDVTTGPEIAARYGHMDPQLYELVGAIAHEVRNPLVSIRTFSELLPERYDDPEFRDHFRELVVKDVQRIDRVVSRLQSLAEGQRKPEPVDMARLLDRLLDDRRPLIQSRRLLVLKELDHTSPLVNADAEQIEDAIAGLVDRAIEQASERGDVYLASKYDDGGRGGRPKVRVLIRHTRASSANPTHKSTRTAIAGTGETALDLVLAKRLIEAQGGELSVDEAEVGESVIVIDLPAA